AGGARVGGAAGGGGRFRTAPADATRGLLIGLAESAPRARHDFEALAPLLRPMLSARALYVAAGAALWRTTWRVNRDWLVSLDPADEALKAPGLRSLVMDVLVEHLGRRPDLGGRVRTFLAALSSVREDAERVVRQLARLGSRGWGVLVPMLHPTRPGERFPVSDKIREAIFREATSRPAVLSLVHHHAHAKVATAVADGTRSDLLLQALRVVKKLGPAAGLAIPELLNLVVRVSALGPVVGAVIPSLAGGYPNATAAVVRTLHRIRTTGYFTSENMTA